MRRLSIFILFCVLLTSCTGLFMKVIGMKKLRPVNNEEIQKYAKKYHIPAAYSFVLDTAKYMTFLRSIDTAQFAPALKNHAQPLQALYFDTQGKLTCWYINCYCGGFPNLKWDRDSAFATFPAKQQAPLDSLLTFSKLYSMVDHVPDPVNPPPSSSAGGFVVVFWDRWMGRQSERLIEYVQKNAAGHNAHVIYVNNDNLFAGMTMENEN
jgi:hypothetical protein